MRKFASFILGAALGGLIGGMTAILLAPSSGNCTRQRLREYVEHIQLEVKQAAELRRGELQQQLAQLREPIQLE